jgi:hypothetical protein
MSAFAGGRTIKSPIVKIMGTVLALSLAVWPGCKGDDKPTDPQNHAPLITSLTADPDTFVMEQSSTITVVASDLDNDALGYTWEAPGEKLQPIGGEANTLRVSNCCPIFDTTIALVIAIVDDGRGGEARDSIEVCILPLP